MRAGLIVGPHDPADRFVYWPRRDRPLGRGPAVGAGERGPDPRAGRGTAAAAVIRLSCLDVTTGPVSRIDEQILAIWCALRVNPSLDARWAMEVIDRLLDERPRPEQVPPPVTPPGPAAPATSTAAPLAGEPG